jgi:hypothetical protein
VASIKEAFRVNARRTGWFIIGLLTAFFAWIFSLVYDYHNPRVVVCLICDKEIPEKELRFAEDPGYHPGILGPIHPACYYQAVEEMPDLPWTDPISGEVDYDEMSESIGLSDPETDFEEECY